MTQKTLCGWVAALLISFMSAAVSSYVYATDGQLRSDLQTTTKYAVVNHTQQGAESSNRAQVIAGASPAINGRPTAYHADSIGGQFMEWYTSLGRHEKAGTFELLLIGCCIGLRIYSKRQQRSPAREPTAESTAANSLIGVNE